MVPALLWLIAGVVLIAAEVLSGDFVLVMLGAGALAAAGASALGVPLGLDAAVFAALSLGLIFLARPALKRRMRVEHELKTNVDALVGHKAVVESTVDAHGGRVRIGGELWSARAFDETQVMHSGQTVTVMEISGATAVVWAEP
ncbi:membrane protein implicated in regulation of membrane protease activity [Saccharopolyspora erythraea NRRL 2338]|uniref:Membrane protein implicated in regulation of membrane protease activity n=2 Tax=Saccharopolyspora erythraea TaxID=1836 RepID=A4FG78_SACEN|nr:NfeD family protein [Saccharopolyspora erythraea]EQD81691.1 membrane protein [Saccharopolyspora erythraea D]PFG96758.1 membrane protein implicated in regulation of membrane protease activity [Saccharopolyspora erythraea NRRL 2338]QRK87007.1 NfeD family protein [Saccharopolyspora erythraea]CAM03053.1 membrane protein implicated in regulation of membrane protease activity [Saccharopolyspora erythraea NRRL 2338]